MSIILKENTSNRFTTKWVKGHLNILIRLERKYLTPYYFMLLSAYLLTEK
jgi:hypothetical protein